MQASYHLLFTGQVIVLYLLTQKTEVTSFIYKLFFSMRGTFAYRVYAN